MNIEENIRGKIYLSLQSRQHLPQSLNLRKLVALFALASTHHALNFLLLF